MKAAMTQQPRPKSSAGHFRQPVGVSIVEIASGARKYMGGPKRRRAQAVPWVSGGAAVRLSGSAVSFNGATFLTLEEEK